MYAGRDFLKHDGCFFESEYGHCMISFCNNPKMIKAILVPEAFYS